MEDWLKGWLIGILTGIILVILLFIVPTWGTNTILSVGFPAKFTIQLFMRDCSGIIGSEGLRCLAWSFAHYVVWIIIDSALIGFIIGWIVGKIKSRNDY
jgi:hypothetical protein